jgi:hypothetical protein
MRSRIQISGKSGTSGALVAKSLAISIGSLTIELLVAGGDGWALYWARARASIIHRLESIRSP